MAADRERNPGAGPQTPGRVYRLGHILNSEISDANTRKIILPELAKLGFVEGRNLVFDGRVGELDSQTSLMRELLATNFTVTVHFTDFTVTVHFIFFSHAAGFQR